MRYDRVESDDGGSGQSSHLSVTPSPREPLPGRTDRSPLLEVATSAGDPPPADPTAQNAAAAASAEKKDEAVAWKDLPNKRQLFIITMARVSEPLVQTSLQSYMFYQLKWFDPSLPDSTISAQAGVMHASFMAAQFITAMLWGRFADSPRAGRKMVLLIGLTGTSLSCLGFGFSTSFWQALSFRILGGVTNGNVGVMRTMISEIVREKKYQSRAFLLLPMTFNIGIIVGPILGGMLSDPAGSYPSLFGHVEFFRKFPYAAPNILSCIFLANAALMVWLGLDETLDALRARPKTDLGRRLGRKLEMVVRKRIFGSPGDEYEPVPISESDLASGESPDAAAAAVRHPTKRRFTQHLPFRRIFTRNVVMTLLSSFIQGIHVGSFNSLWFVFLSTPVWDPQSSAHPRRRLPFFFTGGLGLPPQSVGLAMSILGVIGITMQLFLYPRIAARFGTIRAWRGSLLCFPAAYFLVPYLSVVPSSPEYPPPAPKAGAAVWLAICVVLTIQVLGRTFALPCQTILVNNCSPHPSVLGTIHGMGQSVSSAARTMGPMLGGVIYGFGLNSNVVGLVFWILCCVALCGIFASAFVREGDGHEIWLEGDDDDTETSGSENQTSRA